MNSLKNRILVSIFGALYLLYIGNTDLYTYTISQSKKDCCQEEKENTCCGNEKENGNCASENCCHINSSSPSYFYTQSDKIEISVKSISDLLFPKYSFISRLYSDKYLQKNTKLNPKPLSQIQGLKVSHRLAFWNIWRC